MEQCKSVTTRSGIVVGKRIGNNLIVEKKRKIESEEEKEENKEKKKRIQEEKERKRNGNRKNSAPLLDLPYLQALSRRNIKRKIIRFCEIVKQLDINIPFTEALEQMLTYVKFMKDLLTKKRRLKEQEIVELEAS